MRNFNENFIRRNFILRPTKAYIIKSVSGQQNYDPKEARVTHFVNNKRHSYQSM